MDPRFATQIAEEELTEFHKVLLLKCKNLVDMSRKYMQSYYSIWDHNYDVYSGVRQRDKEDQQSIERKEPEKMVVPLSFAQVQTFTSFCASLFTQRERIFEFIGTGEEDHRAAKVAEALVHRDLTVNVFESRLDQFLTDLAVFGLGVFKLAWVREMRMKEMVIDVPPPMALGQPMFSQSQKMVITQPATSFLGNRIVNVSPYSFFPDVRMPLGRFQEGEFVASEDIYCMTDLYQWQFEGLIVGLEHVKPYKGDTDVERLRSNHLSRALAHQSSPGSTISSEHTSAGTTIVTEVQLMLIPKLFTVGEGDNVEYPFGDSEVPEKWLVWYANDNRIINIEKLDFDHGSYTYDLAEFCGNNHKLVNIALCDIIDKLQDVQSWLINTHVTNVRKVVGDKLIVDPSRVEMADLKERRPVIRLSKNAAGTNINEVVQQLKVTDVTARHMDDANSLHGLIQVTTGINDNALGQYFSGRRTATEARNANSGAAARLKKTATLIFRNALEPMARKMVSNHKQGLDESTYVQVLGELSDPMTFMQFIEVSREDLVGSYDVEVFDGTLPSERAVQAQALEDFLLAILGQPAAALMLGYDPMKLVEEWLELRGIRHPGRFKLTQLRQQELMMQMQAVMQKGQEDGQSGQPGLPGGQGALPGGGAGGFAGLAGLATG